MSEVSAKSGTGSPAGGEPGRGVPWGVVIPVLLVVGVLVCFSPAFGGELLAWDDRANFVDNTQWQGLGAKNLEWMATSFHLGHYQPVTWLSFGLQHALGASSVSAMHVGNVVLHAVNAVLFFVLCRGLLRRGFGEGAEERLVTLGAGLAAGLFALHPLRVESVAWVTERRDVLSTAFLLGAALAYLKSVNVGQVKLRSLGWFAMCAVLLLLSCLSKAWGMSFFVVLLAMDVYPLRRLGGRGWLTRDSLGVVLEKWPMVVIGLGTAWIASQAQQATSAAKTLEEWPISDRLVQSAYGLWFYIRQSVAPSGLSPLYQLPKHMDLGETWNVVGLVFSAALLAAVVWCWRKRPGVSIGLLVYLVLISPVLGLMQSGEQLVADRYSYLATMPLALLVSAGAVVIARRSAEGGSKLGRLVSVCAIVALACLGLKTYSQTAVWRTSELLWAHAVNVTPTSMVLVHYGSALQEKGKADEAMEAYAQAFRVNPQDGRAMFSYAMLLESKGRTAEAEQVYVEAIKFLRTLRYRARENLGVIYWNQGKYKEALREFELAIEDVQQPGHKSPSGSPFVSMALAKLQMGERAAAISLLRQALGYRDTRSEAERKLRELGVAP